MRSPFTSNYNLHMMFCDSHYSSIVQPHDLAITGWATIESKMGALIAQGELVHGTLINMAHQFRCHTKGRFIQWQQVERLLIFTNLMTRNQEFGLSTLHTRGQSLKAIAIYNAYMVVLFDQGDKLLKEVWVGHDWKPKPWSRGR